MRTRRATRCVDRRRTRSRKRSSRGRRGDGVIRKIRSIPRVSRPPPHAPAVAPPPHAVNSHAAPPRPSPHGEDALPGSLASTKPHPRIVSVAPARADASLGDAEMTSASRYRMDACSAPAEARSASEGGVKFAGRIASRAYAVTTAGSEQQLVVGSQNCTDSRPPRRPFGPARAQGRVALRRLRARGDRGGRRRRPRAIRRRRSDTSRRGRP